VNNTSPMKNNEFSYPVKKNLQKSLIVSQNILTFVRQMKRRGCQGSKFTWS